MREGLLRLAALDRDASEMDLLVPADALRHELAIDADARAGRDRRVGHVVERIARVVDAQGHQRYQKFGEGDYERSEIVIQQLLSKAGASGFDRDVVSIRATGAEAFVPYQIALLAEACEIAGRSEEASDLLDDALQIIERTGERWLEAELHRHKGQLLLRQGHSEPAEELYHKALCIAQEQEGKLWELRAVASLARLRRDHGRHAEARDLLAPIYGWFTEGFDTPVLQDAKTLFDQLV